MKKTLSTVKIVGALWLLAAVAGCHPKSATNTSKTAGAYGQRGYSTTLVRTTYFGGNLDYRNGPGPGNFACTGFQNVKEWYVAPSDTFGDPEIWDGEECPPNANGIPECTQIMQRKSICGRKVKVKCGGSNCRPGAPEIVLQITDACPKNHRSNVGGACQGGPAFDLSQSAWERMHAANDNISVYYQRVDDSTPLGPVTADNDTQQRPATRKTVEDADGAIASDGKYYPYCTNGSNTGGGFGWQPELGGPNDGSCIVRSVPQPVASAQPTAPTPLPVFPTASPVSDSSKLAVVIEVTSTWESGYCANIKLQNTGSTPTKSWTLALNKNGTTFTQTWNLSSIGNTGDTATYKPVAEWNAVIPAGGSANQQGFCVSRSSTSAEVKINSVSAE